MTIDPDDWDDPDEPDPRNARSDDHWTSLEGTRGINRSHLATIVAFMREHRQQGWTHGELSEQIPGLTQANAHKRLSDGERGGLVRKSDQTRRWHGSNREQVVWVLADGEGEPAMVNGHNPESYSPAWWAEQHGAVQDAPELSWIEASYHGRCAGCRSLWEPGELIAFDDDLDGWIGTCCAEGDDL